MMKNYQTIILTELKFHCMFLIHKFQHLLSTKDFTLIFHISNGVNVQDIINFHKEPGIISIKNASTILNKLYGGISETERVLLEKYGVPQIQFDLISEIFFIKNLNEDNLEFLFSTGRNYRAGVFLDYLLNDRWINLCNGSIINAHSAVLPNARGMYAIEQIVASGDYDKFIASAGATIHFIDSGIDTGKIIKSKYLTNPFSYGSIWEVKAECFLIAYDLLYQYIKNDHMENQLQNNHVEHHIGKVYLAKNFTQEVKYNAQHNYKQLQQLHSLPKE